MPKPQKIHVYFDGNCPMCTAFANTVSSHPNGQKYDLIDANTNTENTVPRETLLHEIHVFETDGTTRTGADAVFTTLANIYPWIKPLAYLVRLPIISQLSQLGYFFISRRRNLWFGNETARAYWLFLLTNLGFLLGILLSYRLWGTDRMYYTAPAFSQIQAFSPFTNALSLALILSLLFALFTTQHFRVVSVVTLFFLTPLISLDVTRLQPWVWHYLVFIFIFIFWDHNSKFRTTQIIDALKLAIVGIYFWSGVQKITPLFFTEIFPWFTKPLWEPFGEIGYEVNFAIGMFVPFIESAFAIGLLTKRFRNISILGSGAMLLLVTASLMFGHGWNSVVWPWNFTIFLMVIALFYRNQDTFIIFFTRIIKNLFGLFIISLFIVLPLGSFFDRVDHYLSWSLYSGNIPTATISASEEIIAKIAPSAPYNLLDDGTAELDFTYWSITTVNVVPYPEIRVFKSIFKSLCEVYGTENELTLNIKEPRSFISNQKESQTYTCSDLN